MMTVLTKQGTNLSAYQYIQCLQRVTIMESFRVSDGRYRHHPLVPTSTTLQSRLRDVC